MSDSLRAPLIVLELIVLGAILALVGNPVTRVALGLIVGLLLAYSALKPGETAEVERVPEGYDDRRQDHLFRHWVNVLLKKIREFHSVCEGVSAGGMNSAVGELRLNEVEREIQDLISQVTESAKPANLKQNRSSASSEGRTKRIETYGETATPL